MPRRMANAFALFEGKLNLYLLQGVPNRIFMKPTSTWQVDIGELSQDWVVYFLNIRKLVQILKRFEITQEQPQLEDTTRIFH